MNRRKEIISIVIGIFAVMVILVGQFNYYPAQVKAMQEISTDEGTESQEEAVIKIYTNDAVSSAVHFSFNQILHFISDVYSETVEETWGFIEDNLNPIDFFETLFQRIISTNAP